MAWGPGRVSKGRHQALVSGLWPLQLGGRGLFTRAGEVRGEGLGFT